AHLDRHLVGRTAHPAGLHLDGRLDVVQCPLERDHRVGAPGLVPAALERAVDDPLGDRALAVHQHLVDQLGDQRRAVHRVEDDLVLRGRTLAGHQLFSFFAPYRLRACLRLRTPWVSSAPRITWYRTPGRSRTRPPRTSTIECSCRLWPTPGM